MKAIRHMDLVLGPLASDVYESMKCLEKNKSSQYWRRIMLRSICAHIEALLFQMKVTMLKLAPVARVVFTAEETEILTEMRAAVPPKQARPKFIPMAENVKAVLSLFGRLQGATFSLETNGEGWQHFLYLVAVRNRITHPKEVFD
ncbi:MAG TPA: hypothetical protein VGF13_16245, partial [Verrucomicrobiae bacterium]